MIKFENLNEHLIDEFIIIAKRSFLDTYDGKSDNPAGMLHSYVDETYIRDNILNEMTDQNTIIKLIYMEDQCVGHLKMISQSPPKSAKIQNSLFLNNLYLLSEYQGKKIGAKAMNYVFDYAKNKGFEAIWLGVWEKNVQAIKFYQRLGFKKFGEKNWIYQKDELVYQDLDWLMEVKI